MKLGKKDLLAEVAPSLSEGSYAGRIASATIYMSENYEGTQMVPKIDFVWETNEENDDGDKVRLSDNYIGLKRSNDNRCKLYIRLKPFVKDLDLRKGDIGLEGDFKTLDDLPEGRDNAAQLEDLTIDGESVFNKWALLSVDVNDRGYTDIIGVSKLPKGYKVPDNGDGDDDAPAAP